MMAPAVHARQCRWRAAPCGRRQARTHPDTGRASGVRGRWLVNGDEPLDISVKRFNRACENAAFAFGMVCILMPLPRVFLFPDKPKLHRLAAELEESAHLLRWRWRHVIPVLGWKEALRLLFTPPTSPDREASRPAIWKILQKSYRPITEDSPLARALLCLLAKRNVLARAMFRRQLLPYRGRADVVAIVYNGYRWPDVLLKEEARRLSIPVMFVENGYFPGTYQLDAKGVNCESSLPHSATFFRREARHHSWEELPKEFTTRPVRVACKEMEELPKEFFFVPFQVPIDIQVKKFSPWVRDMHSFYEEIVRAAEAFPQLHFVIKEHPSWKYPIRDRAKRHPRVHFANLRPTKELLEAARAVVVINSTVGLEALVLKKRVIVLGKAIYNLPDLVLQAHEGREAFHRCLAQIDAFQPDPDILLGLLAHVHREFLARGSWSDPPPDFPREVARKRAYAERHAHLPRCVDD